MALTRPLTRPLVGALSRGLTQAGAGGGAAFSPADRFTGINGFWYAPNDLSTMFQDAAGTVPVTATGQTVKRINDKSGNGHHIANAAANWTLQNDGTNNYLLTDGAVRLERSAFAWGTDELSFFAALKPTAGGETKDFMSFGQFTAETGSFEVGYSTGGIYAYRRKVLEKFVKLPMGKLEALESLEQLRAMENGMEIAVARVPKPTIGVDTPEDLARVEALLSA